MIEEISGAGGGGGGGKGGGGGSEQRAPVEAPNTLRSASTARIIDMLGEGPIVGLVDGMRSVFLDDTPLQNADSTYNFKGVTIHTRNGDPVQGYIPGFSSVETEVDVSVQVKTTQPVVRTVSNPDVDAIRVKIRVPTLTSTSTTTGDIKGTKVKLAVDVMPASGAWKEQKVIEITGKTTSVYERQARVEMFGEGPWNIRVRRITADSEKTTLQNETHWSTYTEITDAKLSYPDSALVGIQIDARQFGNTVPSRSYDVKGRIIRVPSNYDQETRAYSGIWNGTFKLAWTDNPAWVFYDMATHTRYGANQASVDKWSLYQIGQYCDELVPDGFGGTEPRFTVNTVIAEQADAIVALAQMASAFRGMVYWGTNTAVPVADMPSDPVMLVTPANVIGGDFEYSGTSLRDRHSVAAVTWNDPADNYKQQIELVEDAETVRRVGWRQTDVTAFGCTSIGQAHRLGKWILYSEQFEAETVTYSASMDHLNVRPGDIIAVSDPATAGARMGGRVVQVGLSSLVLDAVPTTQPGSTLHLDVMLPSGVIERREVLSVSGNSVQLTAPLSTEPLKAAMWVLSSVSLKPRLFRVSSVSEDSDGLTYQVTAAEYAADKYDHVEQGLPVFEQPVFAGIQTPRVVEGLVATDVTYRSGSGIATKLSLSWDRTDDNALTWSIRMRDTEDGNWDIYDNLVTPTLEIPNVTDGATYIIECYAVSSLGRRSAEPATYSYTVLGKVRPPADVTGFVSAPEGSSLKVYWDSVQDVDIKEYEVRYQDSGWGGTDPLDIAYRGPSNSFTAGPGSQAFTDNTLFVRAVDTSGNYSLQAAMLNVEVMKPATPAVSVVYNDTSSVAATARVRWTTGTSDFAVYQHLVEAALPDGRTISSLQGGTSYDLPLDFLGVATVSVRAVDAFGQMSNAAVASVTSLAPAAPSTYGFHTADVGVLQLSWSLDGRTTLPIAGYEVRSENTGWGSAGYIHRGAVNSCQITGIAAGLNNFYIRSYDTEGHYGTSSLAAIFDYTGPVLDGVIAYYFESASFNRLLPIRWPTLDALFGVDYYEVTLTRPAPAPPETYVTRSTEWLANLNWIGEAEVTVVGYDNAGAVSAPLSTTITRITPQAPTSTSLSLISYTNKAMTVEISWPADGLMTTLPIQGFELRASDSGWGTTGAVYKGEAARATLVNIRPDQNAVYYLKSYDSAGAYSAAAYAVNILKNVGPEPVTLLTAAPNGQNLRVKWKAAVATGGEVRYEVRSVDANWGEVDDTRLYYGSSTYFDIRLEELGTHTFYVKALDKFWEYSYAVQVSYEYEVATIGGPTHQFGTGSAPAVTLKWPQSKPAFGLSDYALSDGVDITYIKSNSVTVPATWLGVRTFTIAVRDRNQNLSEPVPLPVDITLPVIDAVTPSLTVGASAKNKGTVYLAWTKAVKGSLPILGYEVRAADANWGLGDALYEGPDLKTSFPAVPMDSVTTWYLRTFDNARNYSGVSKVIVNNGVQPPAAVSGLSHAVSGSAIVLSWDRSGEADVVEYEIRTSSGGWGSSGYTYRGPLTSFTVAKPPLAGATYYIAAKDAYGQRSPVASVVFVYPTPVAPADTTYAFGATAGTLLIDWPDTNPALGLKAYKVVYQNGAVAKTLTSKASSVTITPAWSGSETVSVQVIDTYGVESPATTLAISVVPPGQVVTPVLSVTSLKRGAQSVLLNWPEPTTGSFKIAGYEVRGTSSGWGTPGYLYRGAASQAALAGVSTTAATTWYIKAYDTRNNYSSLVATLTYSPVVPDEVVSVSLKRISASLQLTCVTPVKPSDFSHVEYRVGKVTAGATTGNDVGINEGVTAAAVDIWDDPDVVIIRGTETSDSVLLPLQLFPSPRVSKTGITYRVSARQVDKGGNISPNSAKSSIVIKSLI